MQMSRPPRMSTVEVVGLVTAFARAPYLNGATTTISANGDHRDSHHQPTMPFGEPGEHTREVGHEQSWIDRHVEDRSDQREPGFLESPEVAHGASHPCVVAAFERQGARKLANHES